MKDFKKQIIDFITRESVTTFPSCKTAIVGADLHYKNKVSSDYNLTFFNLLQEGIIIKDGETNFGGSFYKLNQDKTS